MENITGPWFLITSVLYMWVHCALICFCLLCKWLSAVRAQGLFPVLGRQGVEWTEVWDEQNEKRTTWGAAEPLCQRGRDSYNHAEISIFSTSISAKSTCFSGHSLPCFSEQQAFSCTIDLELIMLLLHDHKGTYEVEMFDSKVACTWCTASRNCWEVLSERST